MVRGLRLICRHSDLLWIGNEGWMRDGRVEGLGLTEIPKTSYTRGRWIKRRIKRAEGLGRTEVLKAFCIDGRCMEVERGTERLEGLGLTTILKTFCTHRNSMKRERRIKPKIWDLQKFWRRYAHMRNECKLKNELNKQRSGTFRSSQGVLHTWGGKWKLKGEVNA